MQADSRLPKELPGDRSNDFCPVNTAYHSPGLWSVAATKDFLQFALPRLQLQLALIFILTHFLRQLFRPFGFQRIVPQILAGVILGPSFMGKITGFSQTIFPPEGHIFLDALSKLGFVFFMFLTGVQMDVNSVMKSGKRVWIIGLISVLIPISVGTAVSFTLGLDANSYRLPAIRAIIGIQTLTPFAVIACFLIDLKIVNSELGRLALASTLISDLVSSVCTTGLRFVLVDWNGPETLQAQGLNISFLLIIMFFMRRLFIYIIKQTPEGKPVDKNHIIFVSLTVLISAVISDTIGLQYQFGPFILGLTVPSGPPLGSTLVERLGTIVTGLFAPLIVNTCGLMFDLFEIFDQGFIMGVWVLLASSIFLKLISIVLPAMLCEMPVKDGFALSIIMSTQGVVELALYQNYFTNQTIDRETFASATMSVLLMDMASTHLVRSLYDFSKKYKGYEKRDIMSLPSSSEFRVLVITHRYDDAVSATKLLELSSPTRASPTSLYVLNLVEIVGHAPPQLINHDLGQKASSTGARSSKTIDVFRTLGEHNPGFNSVQAFTAMSLPRFMKDDICSVAFNNSTSLVILPFHRKWNQKGNIVFDNSLMRTINYNVLDEAPCSVAIFIDRQKMRQVLSFGTVVMIFIGGEDDREAVAYGLRMATSPDVQLSIIRLMAKDYTVEDEWETILNMESLKIVKLQSINQENIVYKEEMLRDESETALMVHELAKEFDFIIVGRRHKPDSPLLSGFSEFCELPELGPLGDMIASSDMRKPVSALVVQRQLNRTEG